MTWLLRRTVSRAPSLLLLAGLLAQGLGLLLLVIARRWWLAYPLGTLLAGWWLVGHYGAVPLAAAGTGVLVPLAAGLAGWAWLAPTGFERTVGGPVRSWRRGRYYRARWEDAMYGCELVRAQVPPVLMSVRSGANGVDRLSVHMAPGQLVTDWRDAAPRVAGALEVRSVRARAEGPRDVLLLVRWRAVRTEREALVAEMEEVPELAGDLVVTEPEPEQPRSAFPRRPR